MESGGGDVGIAPYEIPLPCQASPFSRGTRDSSALSGTSSKEEAKLAPLPEEVAAVG